MRRHCSRSGLLPLPGTWFRQDAPPPIILFGPARVGHALRVSSPAALRADARVNTASASRQHRLLTRPR